jgi:type I restriction enzyme R subunit
MLSIKPDRPVPSSSNLQRHYEDVVEAYNREKDRVTIEKTFDALLKFVEELDDESKRVLREGLDEESLVLFDLLLKPGLEKREVDRIKKVAADLLATLKSERLRVENWCEKESTRDAVHVAIQDFCGTTVLACQHQPRVRMTSR